MKKKHSVTWVDRIEYFPPPILSPLFQQEYDTVFSSPKKEKTDEPRNPKTDYTFSDFEIHISVERIRNLQVVDDCDLITKTHQSIQYDIHDYMGFKWFLKIDGKDCESQIHSCVKVQIADDTICLICNDICVHVLDRIYYYVVMNRKI